MKRRFTPEGEQVRWRFPGLTDNDFIAILREEEATHAIVAYLREFVKSDDADEESPGYVLEFEQPLIEVAQHIAKVALGSVGSFGFDQPDDEQQAR